MNSTRLFISAIVVAVVLAAGAFVLNSQKSAPAQTEKTTTQTPTTMPTPTNSSSPTQSATQPTTANTATPTSAEVSATKATIKTAKGNIVLVLYPKDAPKTVTNFATLAKRGYFDNLTFHRVEDWVIQGGDPSGNGTGGTSIYGDTFEDELNPNTPSYKEGYKAGVLAMANRGPNTNGSQFFILKVDYPLNHAYTIFGKVTTGMDVVQNTAKGDKILGVIVE